MSDELLKRLETGHDKECAMSYGMHEHCCDCSYPARQEAAARVRELEAELDRAHVAFDGTERMLRGDKQRAEAERDALRADNERLRGVLQRLIDANPRYNAGERLQLDLEAALAAGGKT
jgi:hypothetical protein